MELHRQLSHGFLKAVYQEALALEFAERNIPFERKALSTFVPKAVAGNAPNVLTLSVLEKSLWNQKPSVS